MFAFATSRLLIFANVTQLLLLKLHPTQEAPSSLSFAENLSRQSRQVQSLERDLIHRLGKRRNAMLAIVVVRVFAAAIADVADERSLGVLPDAR